MNSSETPIDPDEDVEVGDDVTEDVVEEAEAPEDG